MTLTATLISPAELKPDALAAWREFQGAQPALASPLLAPEFAQAVGRHRNDAAVAVLRQGRRLVGFLPHHRRAGAFARPIGAVWSDFQALIAEPGADWDGASALAAAGIASLKVNGLLDPQEAFDASEAAPVETHAIAFEHDAGAFWESRRAASPKRFKNLRRVEHKLAREIGELAFVGPDHSAETLDLLFTWKSEQFRRTGRHDVLASRWSRRLMTDLFTQREGAFRGLLLTLHAGGRPVAAHFGVRLGPVFHPWITAFDPALCDYSPGWVFFAHAVAAMPGLGLTRYELAGGHDHYKLPLCNVQTTARSGLLHAAGLDPRVGALAIAGRALRPTTPPLLDSVRRRLDHIAAAEPSLGGRLQGLAAAIAAGRRRAALRVSGEADA